MEALLSVLMSLWERIWPFAVVDPWELGVRVTLGRWYKAVKPGAYWRWPFGIQTFRTLNVQVQTVDLPEITVETKDRQTLIISLGTRFRVTDIVKAVVETQDFENSLLTDVTLIATEWVNTAVYNEVTVDTLIKNCQPKVKWAARRWGCEVEVLGVNCLAKHRVYRLVTTQVP
jgi:regulator of protease activity HflC (stomatin/prohibitin superfamily)